MCGIAGYFAHSRSDLDSRMRSITDCLTHRGPDSSGIWVDENLPLALGHRRLAILDLSAAGHQPMISPSGRYVIVFNGEVFNFAALRNELLSLGHHFRGSGDTEVMLSAFEQWGIEPALNKFIGMFAAAVWDKKDRQLYLLRDRLGIKPLYYGWMSDGFRFASEVSSFQIPKDQCDQQAATYLLKYGYVPAPYSIYPGVWKLPAGCILQLSSEDLAKQPSAFRPEAGSSPKSPHRFWSLQETSRLALSSPLPNNPQLAIDELEKLLKDSVALRLVSDVPIGAFLSGGIDSSLVTAIMSKVHGDVVKTFSVGFENKEFNEAEFAKEVAKHLGTSHHELQLTEKDLLDVVPKLGQMFSEPFADSSQIPMYLIAKLARESVTVALSGDGGDELFCGYNRYTWPRSVWRTLEKIPQGLRSALKSPLRALAQPGLDSFLKPLIGLFPPGLQVNRPSEKLQKLREMLGAQSIESIFYASHELWGMEQPPVNGAKSGSFYEANNLFRDVQPLEQQMMLIDQFIYLADDNLVKVDRASMACSLEVRVPLLDHRIAAFAARLPFDLKYRDGQTKWILRQLLYRYVPKELIERPKMGFSVPLGNWLRGPLKTWAEDLLSEQTLSRLDFLDAKRIRSAWQEHLIGKTDHSHRLWAVLMLSNWRSQ